MSTVRWHIVRSLVLGASVTAAVGFAAPQPAAAQGLFQMLFGGNGYERQQRRYDEPRRYQRQERYERDDSWGGPMSYAPTYEPRRSLPPFEHPEYRAERHASGGGGATHCVRLCDGRYFPVPRAASGARLDSAKVCNALCPKAETQVFHGSNMEYARADDGTRYSELDNAFAFRQKLVPDCSCTGQGAGGLAPIAIESDPTLRVGDVVVTASGPTIFRGGNQFPYKTADFTPIDDYGRLNASLRQKLSELQVNEQALSVVPTATIDNTGAAPVKSQARNRPRRPRSTVTMDTVGASRGYGYPSYPRW